MPGILFALMLLGSVLVCLAALLSARRQGVDLPQPAAARPAFAMAGELRQLDLPLSPAMVEVYQELGNLFRKRGEVERAIGIRQLIIDNPATAQDDKLKAYFAMGVDFRHAGLFNKAIETFTELLKLDPSHSDAGRQLVYLYEEVREWDKAYAARKRVDKVLRKVSPAILAHYKTEQGKEVAAKNPQLAENAFGEAIRQHRQCLDAYLHLGDLYFKQNRARKAFGVWAKAAEISPACAHLILARLSGFSEVEQTEQAITEIFSSIKDHHPLFLLQLAKWRLSQGDEDEALALLRQALQKAPGFMAAHDLRGRILLKRAEASALSEAYQALVAQIKDTSSTSYRCGHCGFTSYYLSWQCPRCRHWDSIEVLTY